jgi:hypothetical protein
MGAGEYRDLRWSQKHVDKIENNVILGAECIHKNEI